MRVLVLGGSVFVGRAVVEMALGLDAEVTTFNRGRSGSAPEGVEQVIGDRTDPQDLARLTGRPFDVVVDTSGYVPADVAASAAAVRADHYSFVSTINVYPGWPAAPDYHDGGAHDGDRTATAVPEDMDESLSYGWLKAGCELAVEHAFGERCSILRAGCIAGPCDSAVGRLPWWIARVARGGRVLVPGSPDDTVALVDARDLAQYALAAVPGTIDATGPAVTRDELMRTCRDVTGSDATFVYVGDEWLAAQNVEPWTEIPLWAGTDAPSLFRHCDPAPGLDPRPLAATVADTWAWQQETGWTPSDRTPGLAPAKEKALLAAFASASATDR